MNSVLFHMFSKLFAYCLLWKKGGIVLILCRGQGGDIVLPTRRLGSNSTPNPRLHGVVYLTGSKPSICYFNIFDGIVICYALCVIVKKTTIKTLVVFIYLPDSIAWCCTLLKLLWVQHIDFHHTLALDLCSLLSLFVCHWYSYYIDSTCSNRSSHRELTKSKNKYLNQLK